MVFTKLYTKRFQKSDWIKEIPLDPSKFRFDIEVYVPNPDDVVIAPERVWRDDIFTYIDLGKKSLTMTQRPVVSLIVERIEVPCYSEESFPIWQPSLDCRDCLKVSVRRRAGEQGKQ